MPMNFEECKKVIKHIWVDQTCLDLRTWESLSHESRHAWITLSLTPANQSDFTFSSATSTISILSTFRTIWYETGMVLNTIFYAIFSQTTVFSRYHQANQLTWECETLCKEWIKIVPFQRLIFFQGAQIMWPYPPGLCPPPRNQGLTGPLLWAAKHFSAFLERSSPNSQVPLSVFLPLPFVGLWLLLWSWWQQTPTGRQRRRKSR